MYLDRRAVWAVCALGIWLGLTGPADAVRLSRSDLSDPGTDASQPQLAANAAGAVVASWREKRGQDWIVRAAVRTPAGSWGPAASLSLPGGAAEGVDVAIGDSGTTAAVWHRAEGARTVVQVAVGSVGGGWSAPETLSDPAQSAYGAKVAVDASGTVTALWSRSDGRAAIVQSRVRAAGGTWSAVADLSEPGRSAFDPQLGVDGAGNAVALWRRSDGSFSLVQAAQRAVGGEWTVPATISIPGGNALTARLAVTRAGRAVAIWRRYNGSEWVIQTSTRLPTGGWGPAEDRSRGAKTVLAPRLIEGDNGSVTAIWTNPDGLWTARRAGDGFGPQRFLTYGDIDDTLAVDAAGGMVLIRGGYGSVSAEFRRPGETEFGEGQELSPCYEDGSETCFTAFASRVVAVSPGKAVALWLHSRANHDVLQTAEVDARPPAPPPEEEPVEEAGAGLEMMRSTLRVSRTGLVRIPVRCRAQQVCGGRVTVRAMVARKRSLHYVREATSPRVHASARIRLGAGARAQAVLHASAPLRAALASTGRVRALVTMRLRTGERTIRQRRVVTLLAPRGGQ